MENLICIKSKAKTNSVSLHLSLVVMFKATIRSPKLKEQTSLRIIKRQKKPSRDNSRTSYDIDIKLGPVTKLDKRNTATSKKIDSDAMSENCDVIVFFQIYGQFEAIQKSDCGNMVYETYIFINSSLLSYKT